jgi:glutathionyl-hydroquinone reductase
MGEMKDQLIRTIAEKAEQEAASLAGEFARAAAQDRELILAELAYNKWLAENCRDCLEY